MEPRNILIVEDDCDIRETEREVLEVEGFDVQTASNGLEAIEALAHSNPCLIMLDLMMPVMNGWQFLEAERDYLKAMHIPVVIMTAGNTEAPSEVAAIVSKPFNVKKLVETINRCCRWDPGTRT